ncbi:trigger factor [Rhodophyticola sp. CCM32]|nr:trigger factor [Rhodophyticola sp. CCM32]
MAALEGVWCLDREIDDRRAGLTGRFVGEAIWAPDGAGLTQTETGLLRYGTAPPMQATRRYIWREGHGGPEVFFADGRPFHQVTGTGAAHHDCPPDVYEVRYEVTDWPLWQSRWQVSGPRKDAVIISRYRRIP